MSERLEREIVVRCAVERAFDAFTRSIDAWWPPGHRRWDGSTLVLEPHVGGRFYERSKTGEESELGAVLAWERPSLVRYSWRPGSRVGSTEVVVRFEVHAAGTRVRVVHTPASAAASWDESVARFEKGWSVVLPALERHLEVTEAR